MFASRRNRQRTATTATPRTYGAKYSARKKLRPRKRLFITRATSSGTTSSSGTLNSTKIPVALMLDQKLSNRTESGSISFW
jgi:hypothetical protein